jgi:flagellar protein FliS
MTLDPAGTYRTTQITTASPIEQVVLLYQGAIRQATAHLAFLERSDLPAAHRASVRCQEIVGSLQESLDLSAGPIATQLDQLYAFTLERLVAGNVAKDPIPTRDALRVLRDLLPAWQAIASPRVAPAPGATPVPARAGGTFSGVAVLR